MEQYPSLPTKDSDFRPPAVVITVVTMGSQSNCAARHRDSPSLTALHPGKQSLFSTHTVRSSQGNTSLSCTRAMLMSKCKSLLVWFPCCSSVGNAPLSCPTVFIYAIMSSLMSRSHHSKPLCLSSAGPHRFSCPWKLFKLVGCALGLGAKPWNASFGFLWNHDI